MGIVTALVFLVSFDETRYNDFEAAFVLGRVEDSHVDYLTWRHCIA